jgi:DNA-binding response OmpR family regulator
VEHIPDLVISDLMMPVMDGMEMCGLIKEDERTSHIPVIMLTARADRDSKLEGLQTGADDYIIKPFDAEELQVRVKNLIEQRARLREKFMREYITEVDEQSLLSPEDKFMKKIFEIFSEHLSEPEFNLDQMTEELNVSRTQLYRKTKAITGLAPKDLLRTFRLKKSVSLFDMGEQNITQVMYQVGFNNLSYFAKCFREQYKVNPSEYIKKKIR